jgi:hypothetical protein
MTTKDNSTMPASLEAEGHVIKRPRFLRPELLNGYELQAIENLVAWVAEEQDAAPETVLSITEASFGAHDVGGIPRKSYDEVVRFLLDLRLDDVLN